MKNIMFVILTLMTSRCLCQDYVIGSPEPDAIEHTLSPIVNKQFTLITGFENVDDPFKKFEQQRRVGKFTQLIGAALLSTSVYLLAKYRDEDINAGRNYEPKKVPSELVLAGGTFLVVGLWIDINAGRHLKKK